MFCTSKEKSLANGFPPQWWWIPPSPHGTQDRTPVGFLSSNVTKKKKEKSLSVSFYLGTTFIRVLPHAYDLYRSRSSAHHQLNEAYIYASPVADFYSTAWDVIIPFVGLLFVGIIYLQQKFGGLCIVPQKLRELGEYEKVPTVTEGKLPK